MSKNEYSDWGDLSSSQKDYVYYLQKSKKNLEDKYKNMKIFVVSETKGYGEYDEVIVVFSEKEKAEEFIGNNGNMSIEEFELDKIKINTP